MINKILTLAHENFTLVGIRTSFIEDDELIIGFIKYLDDKFVTISEIDEYGQSIGKTTIGIDSILKIEEGDDYQKNLKYLIDISQKINSYERITLWKEGQEMENIFSDLIAEQEIITLFFDDDTYVTGFISEYTTKEIVLNNIGIDGREDGISLYFIDRINGIRYRGKVEQKTKILWKKNNA